MNDQNTGSNFVGADAANATESVQGMKLSLDRKYFAAARVLKDSPLLEMTNSQKKLLSDYLCARLATGVSGRDSRLRRMGDIDRAISTWQKLSPDDSERKRIEDVTGKTMALPINLPILATHLDDLASYFTETIAPISNPFFSAIGDAKAAELRTKLNHDALRYDYYSQVALMVRSLLKYNLGGIRVAWDEGTDLQTLTNQPGNRWAAIDPHNTLWDPAIQDPKELASCGEWGAFVEKRTRIQLMRAALAGQVVGVEKFLDKESRTEVTPSLWVDSTTNAGIQSDGLDTRTATGQKRMNWEAYGLGEAGKDATAPGIEVTTIYCHLFPAQFGLLTDAERSQLEQQQRVAESFLELWRFELIGDCVISASTVYERVSAIEGEPQIIPMFIGHMNQDQLKLAQRSTLELMNGFQRFASNMYNIYIQGMRKQVWGIVGYDPTMFDLSAMPKGEVVGIVPMRTGGRDARAGLQSLTGDTGVGQALDAVSSTLALKDRLFPSQALPSQVAGIDRAVTSQVAAVTQGSQRSMKMLLRLMDSSILLPSRLAAFRNYKRYQREGIEDLTDKDVAKLLGSGIESIEAERVADALWKLLYAIVQNQEAMQSFDVPGLLTYISRVGNLSVELGNFARQPPQQQQPQQIPGQPGQPTPEELAALQAQAGAPA